MNKHLIDFIDDELKNNSYYENIRKFAKGKNWNKRILSPIVNDYDDKIDDFAPYRYLDAIENYLAGLQKDVLVQYNDIDEVLDDMWEQNAFENY